MARIRKRKASEAEGLKALKEEEPNKSLCCNVNPARSCSRCPTRYCEDHLKKVYEGEGMIYYIRGRFVCHRCLSIEILFGEGNAK